MLRRNLSKFITQTGLYYSKQLESTFHQFCEKPLHITFKVDNADKRYTGRPREREVC